MAYTTIDDPGLYFNTIKWTGNDNDSRDIDGVGFQPDWVWGKRRDDAAGHNLLDVVRGAGENGELQSNSNGVEGAGAQDRFGYLSAFLSDGFRVEDGSEASGDKAYWNQNNATYVAWCWKAGGSASSNTDGSITSSVSASATAGFSIVSYTGNGSAGATIGHGLGSAPQWIIVKRRATTEGWQIFHTSLGNTKYMELNSTASPVTASTLWNDTSPSSSVVTFGTSTRVNASSNTYIAYCFAEKKGYSRIIKYTGNNSSDGTFVYLGFRPSFCIVKDITSTDPWHMFDDQRDDDRNVINRRLFPNNSNAENSSTDICDFCSTGIKFRGNNDGFNGSRDYILIAFAHSPIVNSNGVPNNAR
jgi:hypothetical protein